MDRKHKKHTKTFEELDYAEQAKSISAQINILEKAIIANARKAEVEQKETPIHGRIEQVERLVQRLKENIDKEQKKTTHNMTVYASPPVGGSGYKKPQSGCAFCAVFLHHIWGKGSMLHIALTRPKCHKHRNVRRHKT
jgi:hypothetical protein